MSKEQIVVEIDSTGEVEIEVNNMKGNKCFAIVRKLMSKITGRAPTEAKHKPEYHQRPDQQQAKQGF